MKERKIIFIICFIVLSTFSSCRYENAESEIEIIDIENAIGDGERINLSSICEKIDYIKLETDSTCIIGKIRSPHKEIFFLEDRIYISDRKNLYCFATNGTFLHKIGSLGRGPGEFGDVLSFTILQATKKIAILSETRRSVYIYNFQGDFLNRIKVDFYPTNISSIGDYLILINCKGRRNLIDYQTFSIYKSNGEFIRHFFERGNEKKSKELRLVGNDRIYSIGNTLHYWEFYYDTIWEINSSFQTKAKSYINYGEKKVPFEYLLKDRKYKKEDIFNMYSLRSIVETDDYLFIDFLAKRKHNSILYNRSIDNATSLRFDRESGGYHFSIYNDIDNGLHFWPDGNVSGESVFSVINGFKIKEKVSKSPDLPYSEEIIEIAKNSKVSDNPVLMVVKLRADE